MFVFRNHDGDFGELEVARQLKLLDKRFFTLVNDVTLKYEMYTTQIDHILLSPLAIFVIETKALNGKITTSKDEWKQTLHGKRVKFMNPYKQNEYHIDILVKISGIAKSKFESLVVFTEDNVEIRDSYNFGILNLQTLNKHIVNTPSKGVTFEEQLCLIRAINTHLCSLKEHLKNMK